MPSSAAFKAYDIRGRVPDELDELLAARIGVALAGILDAGPVVVGCDIRQSGESLKSSLSNGLRASGREVIDIGLCGTEEIYFQTADLGAAGGVMITASHNPIDYNGMKLVRDGARPISGDSGLLDIRDQALASARSIFEPVAGLSESRSKDSYFRRLLGYVDAGRLRPLKIVTNAGNGAAGAVIDGLAPHLPFDFIRIHHEPDGSFPNGIPNPLLPECRLATTNAVQDHGADFGIAWDGDFDRCFFFDGDGRFIEGYYLVGLLAEALLQRSPGGRIVHDPRLVWNTVEMVRGAGGVPVVCKTGHAFIKERMRQEDAVYGGEMSAHHYFRDFAFCDSGMVPWLMVAAIVSASGRSLAELVDASIARYPCSGEINFTVTDARAAIAAVLDRYRSLDPILDYTDGLSADFGEWRLNLRSSNTEPLVRLNIESRGNPGLVAERVGEIRETISMFS